MQRQACLPQRKTCVSKKPSWPEQIFNFFGSRIVEVIRNDEFAPWPIPA